MVPFWRYLTNQGVAQYLKWRYKRLRRLMTRPHESQDTVLQKLLQTASGTEIGRMYRFNSIRTKEAFRDRLPVWDYEDTKPYIQRMMRGEKDVLWNGRVSWYSKSSGTTDDKSKFIPVPKENLYGCHIRGTWDTVTLLYQHDPGLEFFARKSLVMGGSMGRYEANPSTRYGDISALMIHHMPMIGRPFYAPDFRIALLSDWEEKIERTAAATIQDREIVMFGGVPTWNLVLFKRLLKESGASNMLEIWPNLKAYVHGGVGFEPYREQFKTLIPREDFLYMEVYNASEGYFAVSDIPGSQDLLLLVDNSVYYEFIEINDYFSGDTDKTIPLEDVKPGIQYAIVISTNAGLWRYTPGDTVIFTSTKPYRIRITGRTKQFVNAFGEEVIVANTDLALAQTCRAFNAVVGEYTVAPIYLSMEGKGGHQWIIEFEKEPADLASFRTHLDLNLQKLNSDYEAKRTKSLALDELRMINVPRGTFLRWMGSKGKLGGQNKVPRLANHRKFVDEILNFLENAG